LTSKIFGIISYSDGQLKNLELNLPHSFKTFISLATRLLHQFEQKEK
jgi:hypothetical protein